MPDTHLEAIAQKSSASATGLVALILATLFAGAAIYILVAEQPVRLALTDGALLQHWQESQLARGADAGRARCAGEPCRRARLVAGAEPALAGRRGADARQPAVHVLIVIAPVNNALLALGAEQAGAASRALIERWGVAHAVRAGLSARATAAFALAIARG